MLSDEEKQAIEYLKRHIIPCYGRKGTIEFMLNDTLLNLIEKQSKEIEELKEENRKKSIVIIEYQDLYEKLEDKIKAIIEEIDFMIKEINQGHLQKYTVGELLGAKRFLESLLEKEGE